MTNEELIDYLEAKIAASNIEHTKEYTITLSYG